MMILLSLLALLSTKLPLAMADQSYVSSISSGNSDVLERGQLHLEPIPAASFTFSIIFAILTSAQMLKAIKNIHKRLTRKPSPTIPPKDSLGSIFPWLLLLTTVLLTVSYVLHGVWVTFWGKGRPDQAQGPPGDRVDPYACAMHLMTTLADISLVTALLVLLFHQARLVLTTKTNLLKSLELSPTSSSSGVNVTTSQNQKRLTCINIKMIFDSLLMLTMVGLSFTGNILDGNERNLHIGSEFGVVQNGKYLLIYDILFLIAVFNVGLTAILLHTRIKRHFLQAKDDIDIRISKYIGYIISPSFISYSLIPIIYSTTTTTNINDKIIARWNIAYLIIGCIIKCVIITLCLTFGVSSSGATCSNSNERSNRTTEPPKTTIQLRKPLTSPTPCLNTYTTTPTPSRSTSNIQGDKRTVPAPSTSASQSSLDVGNPTWVNAMKMNGQFLANWVI